jgi:radical SAM superfamily enzyme YgiQ (UPF0313 family)
MIIQKQDFGELIRKGKRLAKKFPFGGPFDTSVPEFILEGGADYLILDEGEITIPVFLEALEKGEEKGIFQATEKPDITQSPLPKFDFLDLNAYIAMTVQFSRVCPFQCKFCDIITFLYANPAPKYQNEF